MRIEDDTSAYLDSDVRDVVVPPAAVGLAVGTPQVFRSRNAREWRTLDRDVQAIPVASREFGRAEQLLIRVPLRTGDAAKVSAVLTSRFGSIMRELEIAPGPVADFWQLELPLAGLATGEYRVEITAVESSSAVKERVVFRVMP
jgi:hypothetical protein